MLKICTPPEMFAPPLSSNPKSALEYNYNQNVATLTFRIFMIIVISPMPIVRIHYIIIIRQSSGSIIGHFKNKGRHSHFLSAVDTVLSFSTTTPSNDIVPLATLPPTRSTLYGEKCDPDCESCYGRIMEDDTLEFGCKVGGLTGK